MVRLVAMTVFVASLMACHREKEPAPERSPVSQVDAAPLPPRPPAPSEGDARKVGDAFMAALLKNDRLGMYQRMRRGSITQEELDRLVSFIDSHDGHPTGFQLRSSDGAGTKFSFGSGVRNMRKLVYDVETSSTPIGKYFANLEMISDEGHVVVDSFGVLSYWFGGPSQHP